MPDISQLHLDALLTQIMVGYRNRNLISEIVAPQVLVDEHAGKYFVGDKSEWRPTDDLRRPGTIAGEVEWKESLDTYYCDGHAQLTVIPDEWRRTAGARALNLDVTGTNKVSRIVALNKEVALVAALVAGCTTVNLATGGLQWDDDDNDPVARVDSDKETIIKACGEAPNTLLLSRPVFRGVRNNACIAQRITAAQRLADALVTPEQLASLFELNQVLVADGVKLTSNEGATVDVPAFIWGNYALLFYLPSSPGPNELSLAYTLRWDVGQAGRAIYRYRAVEARHADTIEAQDHYDQKIVVQGAGILYSNAVA